MKIGNRLLSTGQVSKILGVNLNAVYDYIKSSGLKAHKLGGNGKSKRHWRVWEKDLEEFINRQEAGLEHGRHIIKNSSCSELVASPAPATEEEQ